MTGLSLQAYDIHQYDMSHQNSNYGNNGGYQGNSGNRYQYDMSNGNDRAAYSTDTGAQQRDYYYNMYNTSGNRQQDQSYGQYGSGIYGNGN